MSFHSISNAKRRLQDELQSIDQKEELCPLSLEDTDRRTSLKNRLQAILQEEEILWETRAKQRWLKEGDGNTKFFHAVANGRRRTNTIDTIENEHGEEINNDRLKRLTFYNCYKNMFGQGEESNTSFGDWSDLYQSNRLTDPDSLTIPFTLDEVKTATFQLGSDRAPGPDGFSLIFFQTFWDTVKEDIFNVFVDLHRNSLSTDPVDYSYVCLIPKKEGARRVGDFRPISLINGIQKIISKVLANRLARVLPPIIISTQSAFLKDRILSDSFVAAHELLNWCNKTGKECVCIKADFAKAFDHVRWSFLQRILRWLGFSDKWWTWVSQCICNAKIAVLINDAPTPWIKARRGLRQGDPLSPYLFLLVADCLARMTESARVNNLLLGIGPTPDCQTSLLQYADDTLFFCHPRKLFMRNLQFLWTTFEWASGLSINLNKTELFYLGHNSGKAERLAKLLGCKVGSLPFRYLGLPLSIKNLRKEDWASVLRRIEARIEGWKAKLLSIGGRLTLVNSVLTNLPLFYFSIFKAPQWVLHRIEALRRAFFWQGNSKISGGACLVNWKTVCKSKDEGGLGIKDLGPMNLALLSKWWWRFHNEPQLLWSRLIKTLYYTRRRPLHEGRAFTPFSQWWKSVLRCRDHFKCSISLELGKGSSIRMWHDIWIGETPLSEPRFQRSLVTSRKRKHWCHNAGTQMAGDGDSSAEDLKLPNLLAALPNSHCLKIYYSSTALAIRLTSSNGDGPTTRCSQSNLNISSCVTGVREN